jgi:hypothetical protein
MTPLPQHIKATPYLLTGEVIAIMDGSTAQGRAFRRDMQIFGPWADSTNQGKTARIRVTEGFKGPFRPGDTINISSAYTGCDLTFVRGARYVLFLHSEQHTLLPTHCSYSAQLDDSRYVADMMQTIRTQTSRTRRR